jgi:DNA-nicking Smr family endonuclease
MRRKGKGPDREPDSARDRPDPDRPEHGEPLAEEPPPAVLPIEDALDLHPFAPREIPDVVAAYLEEAAAKGFREVRLIHGKGIGVQRERIRALLSRHPRVEGFADAPAERGHWGATIVRLRRNPDQSPEAG